MGRFLCRSDDELVDAVSEKLAPDEAEHDFFE
jgi:hypothetical protein